LDRYSLASKKGKPMTVLDTVRDLVEAVSPSCICDDCIAQKLELSVRQHANHKTRELAEFSGFSRAKQRCSFCGGEKLSIKAC
jgi:SpoU rRNA methylase family enzyme